MINVVMLVSNRPRLTEQALSSFLAHTTSRFRLLIVDDYSASETADMLDEYASDHVRVIHSRITRLGPGLARNIGIKKAELWERGEYLYLCDNDGLFLSGWDDALIRAYNVAHHKYDFRVLGGYCHPYNKTNEEWPLVEIAQWNLSLHDKYAVGHLSCLMTWETYDKYGPFDSSPTTNGSEDFAFCQKVRADGFRVGSIWPHKVLNCGLTGSNGKLSPGSELIHGQDFPRGAIIE